MYGQTEATARISVSAPHEAMRHPDRVGRPIAHTQVELRTEGRVALPGEVVALQETTAARIPCP